MTLIATLGDPAGIGPEVILKSWLMRRQQGKMGMLPVFAVLGCATYLRHFSRRMDWPVVIKPISSLEEASLYYDQALPVLDRPMPFDVHLGKSDVKFAPYIIDLLQEAVHFCLIKEAMGMVTAPIHKATLYESGFSFAGHTEFLEHATGGLHRAVMMLTIEGLRVIPITGHIPLMEVGKYLTEKRVLDYAHLVHHALRRDYTIKHPRLALAALNPHAGEEGTMGREEQDILLPAAHKAQQQGIDLSTPRPADTLFHRRALLNYDAVLCLYHDQALIPLKTLDFDRGVNVTLNLPLVRTSPDHGTAFDIAPQGVASAESFMCALHEAAYVAKNRGTLTL
jgi:4-hydroxythreonine-4-phosphate dehydrogenase